MSQLPRLIYPRRIERRYASLLITYINRMEGVVTQALLGGLGFRQDGEVDDLIKRLQKRFTITRTAAIKITSEIYKQIDLHHLGDFNASYADALDYTAIGMEKKLGAAFVKENVALITSIPEVALIQSGAVVSNLLLRPSEAKQEITSIAAGAKTEVGKAFVKKNVGLIKSIPDHKAVEAILTPALDKGARVEAIAKTLGERFDVARSRARLIARDQVGKYYGQLNAKRQTDAGVEKFEWSSSSDERVRTLHRQINTKVYSYPQGHPSEGLPGQPVQCRCSAIPVISEFK